MNQSPEITELVKALSRAQGQMEPAKFNKSNPHFKSKYADFTSCMEACRKPLADNELCVMQYCETINERLHLVTLLAHSSGQWITSAFPLYPKTADSQAIGSAMTYGKRYSLASLLGIVSDEEWVDDDAESAMGRGPPGIHQKITPDQIQMLRNIQVQLDDECKKQISTHLHENYGIKSLDEIWSTNFNSVLSRFQNAMKYMEQKKKQDSK